MKPFIRRILFLVLVVVAAASTVLCRSWLLGRRLELGLDLRPDLSMASGRETSVASASRLLLTSAATGVFRAVAIDFLWIRAIRLQEQGKFFESSALAKAVVALEPRLPTVWGFQARNLAYNITVALAPEDRYPWVLEAIELLRDEALILNPESPAIYLELAFTFQHKIGGDHDDAAYLYRSELARTFESPVSSTSRTDELEAWGIQPVPLASLQEKWGVTLDFRAAESHALYWAEQGLQRSETARGAREKYPVRGLRLVERGSILQLFAGGRPLRAPLGKVYVFLPDLRLEEPSERVVHRDLDRYRDRPASREIVETFHLRLQGRRIYYHFLFGERARARRLFVENGAGISPSAGTLEAFLLQHISFITGDEEEEGETSETGGSRRDSVSAGRRQLFLGRLAKLLDASLYLTFAGEERPAEGMLELARLLYAAEAAQPSAPEFPLRPLEAYLDAAAVRRVLPWRALPEVWARVPESLRTRASGRAGADAPGLPEARELPFRLELLDPLGFSEGN